MKKLLIIIALYHTALLCISCKDKHEIEDVPGGEQGTVTKEQLLADKDRAQANTEVYSMLISSKENVILGYSPVKDGNGSVIGYEIEFGDGDSYPVYFGNDFSTRAPAVVRKGKSWLCTFDKGDNWTEISDRNTVPQLGLDGNGNWTVDTGSGKYDRITDASGNAVCGYDYEAVRGNSVFSGIAPDGDMIAFSIIDGSRIDVRYHDGLWLRLKDTEKMPVITLDETLELEVEMSGVEDFEVKAPEGWEAGLDKEKGMLTVTAPFTGKEGEVTVTVTIISSEGYRRNVDIVLMFNPIYLDGTACAEWKDFLKEEGTGLLLDYSYAGYKHGEVAPPENTGYKVYNIMDYGADPTGQKSSRAAFLKLLDDVFGYDTGRTPAGGPDNPVFKDTPNAKAVIYFPEGDYILHTSDDNVASTDGTGLDGKKSMPIIIRGGNFVIKGDGRDKTRIIMKDKNLPNKPEEAYSSPVMLHFTHYTSYSSSDHALVSEDSSRGSFSVTVNDASGINEGSWVCLAIKNSKELAADEFAALGNNPFKPKDEWDMVKNGSDVEDYHQVKSVSGNVVTFFEPIMYDVRSSYGWKLYKSFRNHSNVGVEDLTFVGYARDDFKHHGGDDTASGWDHDGAYKPVAFTRLTDSWMRRVDFESVSEGASFIGCANCSAYDITFRGNRGHSSIRSQGSSRIFIGATEDIADGPVTISGSQIGERIEGAGQYHAVGVSKPSMGAVLWRNTWGKDSCFEAHASQPRATLFDCCSGGFMHLRMGGAESELPNHLGDLTLWNFNMTAESPGQPGNNDYNNWLWWGQDATYRGWTAFPAIVIGFNGIRRVEFGGSCAYEGSNGSPVEPESLYEAQLRRRLGHVPAWLQELKSL